MYCNLYNVIFEYIGPYSIDLLTAYNLCPFNSIGSYQVPAINLEQTLVIFFFFFSNEYKPLHVCVLISMQACMEVRTEFE